MNKSLLAAMVLAAAVWSAPAWSGTFVAGNFELCDMIADARGNGFRIIPLCPYVRVRYEKHPDWRDVMTVGPGEKPHLAGH